MRSYEATALIEASPDAVWAILTDAAGYATWDSGVEYVEGRIAEHAKITVHSKVAPGRAFPVKVAELVNARRMVWTGGMPLGLFKGERMFVLSPEGRYTRFSMREEFSGPLLPLIWRSMPDLGPSFQQFADGLKARVEQGRLQRAG